MPGEGPMEIARHLADLGVEELICGGIQNDHKEWLMRKGVTVVDNQRGVAKEIVRTRLGSPSGHCRGQGLPPAAGQTAQYIFIAVMLYMGLKMIGVFAWLHLPI